ncbi:hypothetical protein [Streptomyces lasiicapitis]|uniref:Uncharacterized protein n=1 Tax=Streptomyces lasiicapitis TaxID=1923961 RepID=A0ABQ2MLZ0_9ACTN|nr:hypothetical protein [Streptomyces lasiicapitis]GGO55004.1 hypothetical protein GCM10012286_66120 [Streptomyces lasiicapitis]
MTGTTYPELAAAQACLRLLHTARAALDGPVTAQTAALLAVPIQDADEALRRAGLAGNEAELLNRIYDLAPHAPTPLSADAAHPPADTPAPAPAPRREGSLR